jgi:hypothetical protein
MTVSALVVAAVALDACLAWMHRRGWVYWEGLGALALGGLGFGPGRAHGPRVHRERDVVLVEVGDLPPERYPDRLNGWKRDHPRLRVVGMDNLLQYREDSSHVVLLVRPRSSEAHPRALALHIGDVLDGPEPFTLVPAYSGGAKGVIICTRPAMAR